MNTCYNNYEVDSMFKIGKLENVKNEVVTVNTIVQTECSYENGKKIKEDSFKTLSFTLTFTLGSGLVPIWFRFGSGLVF